MNNSPHRIFIHGKWVQPSSKRKFKVYNPTNRELIATVSDCNKQDVDAAVKAAKKAQTAWWKVPGAEKAILLHHVATEIRKQGHDIARLMTLETGKPLIESIDCIEWV